MGETITKFCDLCQTEGDVGTGEISSVLTAAKVPESTKDTERHVGIKARAVIIGMNLKDAELCKNCDTKLGLALDGVITERLKVRKSNGKGTKKASDKK